MHLITQKALKDAAERFPRHAIEILALGKAVSKGYFRTPEALKGLFPSLDNLKYLDKHYVIDIGGNELRVIVMIFLIRRSSMFGMSSHIKSTTGLRRNIEEGEKMMVISDVLKAGEKLTKAAPFWQGSRMTSNIKKRSY